VNAQTLAAYATVLGVLLVIAGGLWRWWTWRQEHRTLVSVKVAIGFLTFGPKLVDAVILTVFNNSSHPVRVTGVGLQANDGTKRQLVQITHEPGAGIPGTVAPRDQGQTWFKKAEIDNRGGIDVYRPVRGYAMLADRDRPIWSKRRALMKRS
jgi:hypothetical protein